MDFFERELFIEQEIDGLRVVHHAYISSPSESGPLFVTQHGAGSSALSFAACAAEIRKVLPTAGILSIDARNHGQTSQTRSDAPPADLEIPLDLSLETLGSDLVYVVNQTKLEMNWDAVPPLVLVGHSLGGAIITDVAKKGELGSNVLAYAVLDVVEGMH
jgi:protein phosphatase methylesterase 1